jgi:polyisoprenoid-binding protein YceI
MKARADSLVVSDDISEKDLNEIERAAREEILDAAHYPEIVFQSSKVEAHRISEDRLEARIIGVLSLRGARRECSIVATVTFEGDALRAKGGFALRLSEFDIRPISVAGGLLKLKDDVQLSFDILAQPAPGRSNDLPGVE